MKNEGGLYQFNYLLCLCIKVVTLVQSWLEDVWQQACFAKLNFTDPITRINIILQTCTKSGGERVKEVLNFL